MPILPHASHLGLEGRRLQRTMKRISFLRRQANVRNRKFFPSRFYLLVRLFLHESEEWRNRQIHVGFIFESRLFRNVKSGDFRVTEAFLIWGQAAITDAPSFFKVDVFNAKSEQDEIVSFAKWWNCNKWFIYMVTWNDPKLIGFAHIRSILWLEKWQFFISPNFCHFVLPLPLQRL